MIQIKKIFDKNEVKSKLKLLFNSYLLKSIFQKCIYVCYNILFTVCFLLFE